MSYGPPIDPDAGVPLSKVLADPPGEGQELVVTGRIGNVCRSAGCWFLLHDEADGRHVQIVVDLKPAADFTVTRELEGRLAWVAGRLHRGAQDVESADDGDPQWMFHATAVLVEAGR